MTRAGSFIPIVASRRKVRAREAGASLVEYAFILILFLSVILGISGFGHALFVYHHLNNAAKEATRYACVRGSTCNVTPAGQPSCVVSNSASATAGPTTLTDVTDYVQTITPPSIDTTQFTITACGISGQSACAESTPTVCSAAVGSLPATANYPGCTVKVTVSYPYNFIFPLLPSVSTITAPCTTAGLCMSSTSEMIIIH